MPRFAHGRHLGVWLVTAAALCWSTGGLMARLVGTDPWTTIFWRSVFSAVFLAGALAVGRRADVPRSLASLWPIALVGVCFATASTSFIMALSRTSVANTLIIQSLSPFIAGLGGLLVLGERVRPRTWAAMAVAMGGTMLMLWGSPSQGSRLGDLFALLTATAFAAATVVLRRHRAVPMPAAAALAAALGAVVSWAPAEPASVSPRDLALLALFGVGQLSTGLLLFTAGARLIPVADASLIAVLESVLGPVWVWLFLGENPGFFSVAGGAVILGALVAHTAADLARPEPVVAPLGSSTGKARR